MNSVLRRIRKRKKGRTLGPVDIIPPRGLLRSESGRQGGADLFLAPSGFDARGRVAPSPAPSMRVAARWQLPETLPFLPRADQVISRQLDSPSFSTIAC